MKNLAPIKLDSIRGARGVAVVLVMLAHLMSVERKYAGDRILGDWMLAGFSGVDLFFGISGFIMVYVTWNTASGVRQAGSFLLARIGRIYPLYWLVSLGVLLVWWQAPQLVFAGAGASPDIVRSFLLWPAAREPLLPVGWTLIHEMYFYLVFTGLLLVPRKWRLFGIGMWAALVAIGFFLQMPWQQVTPVSRILFSTLTLEFMFGALAAYAFFRWQGKGWQWSFVVGCLVFAWANLWMVRAANADIWTHWIRGLSFAPSLLLILYGIAGAEKNGQKFSSVLTWLGDQSYSLYLTHLLSFSVLGRVWALVARPGIVDNILALALLFSVSLAVGQMTYVLFEKPMVGWVRRVRAAAFSK